ncbi:TPA: amidohydrolase [bacterium]|nr:amidohydrolase [bacterium]
MIIDCHCHAGKGEGLTSPWDTRASLKLYMLRAAKAGIKRTALWATFHSDYNIANREVARIVASRPHRFYGFACIHPKRDRGRIYMMIKEAVKAYSFCGIKVHRHDAYITREVCEVARCFSLPVVYDVMGEIAIVELLAQEYPDVPFIIPHLGSFTDDWKAHLFLIDQLVRHRNIYTDTSGVRRFDFLVQAVQRAGAKKILFGSDGPWLHPAVELKKIFALGLPRSEEQLILGKNFLRLISRIQTKKDICI